MNAVTKKQDGLYRTKERSRWLAKKNLGKKINNDDILEISTGCFWRKWVRIVVEGRAGNVNWKWNNSSKKRKGLALQNKTA